MHTLVGWTEAIPLVTAQQLIAGIPDDSVRVSGDNIVVPKYNNIIGEYAVGLDIQNVELKSPSIKRMFPEHITPIETGLVPAFPPDPIMRKDNPLILDTDEQLTALAGNSNAAPQQGTILVWLGEGPVAVVKGQIFTIEATLTVPATAYGWDNAPIVLSDSLPVGDYDVVGARCELATLVAFRVNFIGGVFRPGTLGVAGLPDKDPTGARYGAMGKWGNFSHLTPPTIDTLDTGAGGAAVLYLDLIKRG